MLDRPTVSVTINQYLRKLTDEQYCIQI